MDPGLFYYRPVSFAERAVHVDFCIYGGGSGGVTGAIEAAKRGYSVALVSPEAHLGGLTAGGLSLTDYGRREAIGAMAREFYRRAARLMAPPRNGVSSRTWPSGSSTHGWRKRACRFSGASICGTWEMQDGAIVALRTVSGLTVQARMFIDATYEGDLLAKAGVRYTVGRESNSVYGENLNGEQVCGSHQFESPVDPYIVPGVPASGLLPGIETAPVPPGRGDRRVQAYNFRMCLTQRADIRIPFPKPANYREELHVLLKRHLATGWNDAFDKFDTIRNGKTDTNNHGAVSTDYIGMNHAWPEADYETRERIFQDHVNYQQGQMWCLANDPEVPAAIREPMAQWGLCRDEFVTTGGWPHALYIREGRRMVSDYVMTEHNCVGRATAEDSVGLGAYNMDSHNCRRLVLDGVVRNEGDVQVEVQPYAISYRSITPARGQCRNLLVTFALSASHIGFGSIRMEPVYMGLSQSAAIAGAIALEEKIAVQDISYPALRKELLAVGQVLEWKGKI